ncbi:ATP-binding cassette domain-containing protein, partial [Streptomyces sp. CB01881]|uniref:ATP-binding cassette domain-containing protein n=1 Tax=Streptomyces sp. CB01881 TaxID=2078691 RepID=UPI001F1205AA
MISANALELRAGARVLIESASFKVAPGDRIGLVGRNGAGKTTLTKVLAGEGLPAAGTVTRSGEVGYLPQDPRTGDLDVLAKDRILSARGLDTVLKKMRENEDRMANGKGATQENAMKKYARLETEFLTKGGYAAEAEAATIAAALGLPDRILGQQLHTLSGGQRRRVELARILFSDSDVLLLDEPTNHLDADSIAWLRDFLKTYKGGFIVISHDVDLVETVVNKVFYLDANRSAIDVYNMGWRQYQQQREDDEKRRKRERANAEGR